MITAVDSTLVQKEEFWLSYERLKSRPSEKFPADFCTIHVLLKALKINSLYSKISENFHWSQLKCESRESLVPLCFVLVVVRAEYSDWLHLIYGLPWYDNTSH